MPKNNYDLSDLGGTLVDNESTNYDLSDLGGEIVRPSEKGLPQQAAVLGKAGAAGVLGGGADFLSLIHNIPAMVSNYQSKLLQQTAERYPESLEMIKKAHPDFEMPTQIPTIPSAIEGIEHGIDTATGGYTETPEEMKHLAEGVKTAGSVASLSGLAKGAVKLGAKSVGKALSSLGSTKPSELIGAGTAGAVSSAAQEDLGPLGGLATGVLSGVGAQKAAQSLGKAPAAIGKFAKAPGEETIGRILSIGANPKQNVVKEMREMGFNVPFHVQLNSPLAYEIASGLRHNFLLSKEYKDQMTNLPQDMLDRALSHINKVHPENIGREASSAGYKKKVDELYQKNKEIKNKVYELASDSIKPGDGADISPILKEMEKTKNIFSKTARAATEEKDIIKIINETEDGFKNKIFAQKEPIKIGKEIISPNDPRYTQILKGNGSNELKNVPLESLDATRKSLSKEIDHEYPVGVKNFIKGIIKKIDEVIAHQPNKEYANNIKAAREYADLNFYQTVASETANDIRYGRFPMMAFDYMTTPENVHKLEHILGYGPAEKQVMNALKRAKSEDVIVKSITKPSDRSLSFANLAKIGDPKSKQKELYEALLGKENYKDLSKLSDFAAEYSYAGKQSHHPGTATKAAELEKAKIIGKNAVDILKGDMNLIDFGTSLAGYTGVPYVISKMVSNQRFIKAAVRFAEARQLNKLSDKKAAQTQMRQIFLKQIAPPLREVTKQKEEDKPLDLGVVHPRKEE